MEAGDMPGAGLNPEIGAAVVPEQLQPQVEAGEQNPGKIVIKESFCVPWVEDPAGFDPSRVGWEQAAKNVLAKIQEMLAVPEVTLTPDGLTPKQAATKEQARLLAEVDTSAQELARSLATVRADIAQTAVGSPPAQLPDEPLPLPDTAIGQLQEAVPVPVPTAIPATETLTAPSPEPALAPLPPPEIGVSLNQLLEQLPAEVKAEIGQRLSEFGEDFNEDKFAQEHPEEYAFINQIITEASDPEKTAEAAGKVKAYLDSLDKQADGDKKKKDFLVNLFGIYKHRLNQEKDSEKRQELKKSMLGLNKELAGLGIGSLGGILDIIIGAIVGEVQKQLK